MSDRDTSGQAPETAPVRETPAAPVREFNENDIAGIANGLPDTAFDFEDELDPAAQTDNPAREDGRDERGRFTGQERAEAEPESEEGERQDGEGEQEQGEQEQDGGEEQPEAPEPKKDAKPDADTFEVDGHKLTRDEIRRGYQRQADYTRKTQALAEETRQTQALRQQVEAERGELGNILNIAVEVIRNRMPAAPDKALIRTDPMAYMEQSAAYEDALGEVNKLLGAQQDVGQRKTVEERQSAEAAQRETQEALRREQTAMLEVLPELRTTDGQQAFMREAVEHGAHYGLGPNDIAGIQDHRALRVLKDAIAYRKLQAAKPAAVERVRTAPPIRPAVRQGPGTRNGQTQKTARDAFRRDPTIDGAVAALPDSAFGID